MRILLAALCLAPAAAFAAGTSSTPPTQTETTVTCPEGSVWDATRGACIVGQSGALDDRQLYEGARELAYFDRPAEALALLDLVAEVDADVLTLRGFATRKAGDWEGGAALYRAALALDPDHWQALSYYGQGLVERGDLVGAEEKLELIRATGGRGTWAETALAEAVETGTTHAY
ncbi:hypothetical protein JQC91_15415 [Jannaschia sp. Os4]|uniref:hypothetical protein n=1 Tax=Jannaschia sp. Os4 TaxID=2807617 RepID=UPI00193A9AFC|nr:hypothetical protein [Jannaschia sp. Os4]MBM2577695.1 hypothetical protein [Jannaschia sp. Os4]